MDAKEFVKKHGWTAVIAAVNNTTAEETSAFESKDLQYLDDKNPMLGFNVKVYRIPYSDVKTHVDAYKLVQYYGGLDNAKEYLNRYKQFPFIKKLNKAIQLVESVNAEN